ncbi:hypothetical protein ScPMuIL_009477 [Solemya velum]
MDEQAKIASQILSFIILVISVITGVVSQCPQGAIQTVRSCAELPIGVRPAPNQARPNSLLEIQRICRNDQLMATAKCMGDIIDKCQGTTDNEQILQRLVNKDKIMSTVKFFCDNIEVYESHAGCISRQHHLVEKCSREAIDNYGNKVKLKAGIEVLLTATCSFQTAAISCLTEIVETKCGSEASAFVQQIADGMRPPVCSQGDADDSDNPRYKPRYNPGGSDKNYDSSAATNSSNVIFLLSLLLLTLSIHNLVPSL